LWRLAEEPLNSSELQCALLTGRGEVTRIPSAVEKGDPQAAEQLLPVVYGELRRLAEPRYSALAARIALERLLKQAFAAAEMLPMDVTTGQPIEFQHRHETFCHLLTAAGILKEELSKQILVGFRTAGKACPGESLNLNFIAV
jgi:hypothetical protein